MTHPRLTGLALGALFALGVFGFAEVIHHANLNPFLTGEPL